jgi:putative SOS response-associated peptidase YedK
MCGRYTLVLPLDAILNQLSLELPDFGLTARYNAAPTQLMPVVTMEAPNQLQLFRWGLIPSWAKDPAIGNKMINARAETLAEKPSFKSLLKRRRCLILADGFYEWKKEGTQKQPWHMSHRDGTLLTLAGLCDTWKDAEGRPVHTFTIITCAPNELMKSIHDRMPAILEGNDRRRWLDENVSPEEALRLLVPLREGVLQARPVSNRVNSPAFDGPEILA